MESIFDEFEKKTIAPQNFNYAIIACLASVVFSYAYILSDDETSLFTHLAMASGCIMLIHTRRYLKNFRASSASYWLKRWLAVYIAMFALTVAIDIMLNDKTTKAFLTSYSTIFYWLYIAIQLANTCLMIRVGISLRNIHNDFIGLLHQLGNVYIYAVSVAEILGFVVYNTRYGQKMLSLYKMPFLLSNYIIISIPAIILAVIFYKASRHRKAQI